MVVFTEPKPHSTFYVFCKTVCKSIQPGKLRVRCRTCKQGTLTLSRVSAYKLRMNECIPDSEIFSYCNLIFDQNF